MAKSLGLPVTSNQSFPSAKMEDVHAQRRKMSTKLGMELHEEPALHLTKNVKPTEVVNSVQLMAGYVHMSVTVWRTLALMEFVFVARNQMQKLAMRPLAIIVKVESVYVGQALHALKRITFNQLKIVMRIRVEPRQ